MASLEAAVDAARAAGRRALVLRAPRAPRPARHAALERRRAHARRHPLARARERRATTPRVTFDDPDLVVAIETLGERAGIALIDRTLRQTYPFVRIR